MWVSAPAWLGVDGGHAEEGDDPHSEDGAGSRVAGGLRGAGGARSTMLPVPTCAANGAPAPEMSSVAIPL